MNYSLRMLRSGSVDVPSPEVYWMEGFDDWSTLEFQVGVIQGGGKTVVINTGFPEDIGPIAAGWREFLGDRAVLQRPDDQMIQNSLPQIGVDPAEVSHVLITPIQLYTTGNLRSFPNAKICVSRRGWIEDIIAPTYPHHVPRQGCISDDDLSWLMFENESNLRLLDDVEEVLPGITCRWAGVHHRSSMLVEVRTEQGLAIVSDCAFHYANVEEGRPLGIAESIIEAHAVYSDIRKRAQHFVPLYDPEIHRRYPDGIIK